MRIAFRPRPNVSGAASIERLLLKCLPRRPDLRWLANVDLTHRRQECCALSGQVLSPARPSSCSCRRTTLNTVVNDLRGLDDLLDLGDRSHSTSKYFGSLLISLAKLHGFTGQPILPCLPAEIVPALFARPRFGL